MIPSIGLVCPVRNDTHYQTTHGYVKAILAVGGAPLMLGPSVDPDVLRVYLDHCDGILFSGGKDIVPSRFGEETLPECGTQDAARDEEEFILMEMAFSRRLPVFCICRGMQLLNCFQGGSLYQDIHSQCPGTLKHDEYSRHFETIHSVSIQKGSLIDVADTTEIAVNSCHHQAVKKLGHGLVPTAYAPDGIIEGIELAGYPFAVGIQWHPESLFDTHEHALKLFRQFVKHCIS